jgi:hypothetical protein
VTASGLRAAALVLASAWCGAMGFFAWPAAGLVLSLSPSRHAGGTVNRALLDALDVASYGAAALVLLAVLAAERLEPLPAVRRMLLVRLALFCAAAAFASHVVITPEMVSLRDQMPTIIDMVPKSDPLRRAWGRLHAFSSLALVARIAASLALVALLQPRRPAYPLTR